MVIEFPVMALLWLGQIALFSTAKTLHEGIPGVGKNKIEEEL
jgi:hypothetical protein